jgi:hypothetical protein
MRHTGQKFPNLVRQIYSAVTALEEMVPGRHFTPDGRMVGSMGEAMAAKRYGIKLYRPSHAKFDGLKDGKEIQIKATQKHGVELKHGGGTLLVLKINHDGSFEEIYSGDANRVWNSLSHRKVSRAGEMSSSLRQLRALQKQVQEQERVWPSA